MGDQNIDGNSEASPPEKYCSAGDECCKKTFKGYPADHECYIQTLPVGFRFKPTDVELISHHLTNKIKGIPLQPNYIQDVNINDYAPAELTDKYKKYAVDGFEWYFYTSRERKYPNGNRPKRDAGDHEGFWKATGIPQPIMDEKKREIGSKRTLVYYERGNKNLRTKENEIKTDYKMHEYEAKTAEIIPGSTNTEHASDQDGKVKAFTKFCLCKIYVNPPKSTRNLGPATECNTSLSPENNNSPPSRADNEEFNDPFPYFGSGLGLTKENELFEMELTEENQTNNFFNDLQDMDSNHPDFYDFDGQELVTDQQRSLISCNRINFPVAAQQKPQQSGTAPSAAEADAEIA